MEGVYRWRMERIHCRNCTRMSDVYMPTVGKQVSFFLLAFAVAPLETLKACCIPTEPNSCTPSCLSRYAAVAVLRFVKTATPHVCYRDSPSRHVSHFFPSTPCLSTEVCIWKRPCSPFTGISLTHSLTHSLTVFPINALLKYRGLHLEAPLLIIHRHATLFFFTIYVRPA